MIALFQREPAPPAPLVRVVSVAERSVAFRAARRHSRLVCFLKWGLPITGSALLAVLYLLVQAPQIMPEGVAITSAAIESGKLVMIDPVMNGFTKDEKPYNVTAKKALQNILEPDVVELQEMVATLPFAEKSIATLIATGGVIDNASKIMTFANGIKITTDDGMTADLQSATVQMDQGSMQTVDPVTISRQGLNIKAQSMQIAESGKKMIFERRVQVTIDPKIVRRDTPTAAEQKTE